MPPLHLVQVAGHSANPGPLRLKTVIDNTLGGIAGSDGLLGGSTGLLTSLLTGMRQGIASAQAIGSNMGLPPLGKDRLITGQTVQCSQEDTRNYNSLPQLIEGREADMAGVLYCKFRVTLAAPITGGSIRAVATLEIPTVGNTTAASARVPINFNTSSQNRTRGDQATIKDILPNLQVIKQQHLADGQTAAPASSENEPATLSAEFAAPQPYPGAPPLPPGVMSADPVIVNQTSLVQFARELGPFPCKNTQQSYSVSSTSNV
jgi:hypothetical protein